MPSHSLRAGAVPGSVGPRERAGALGQGLGLAGAGSRAAPGAVSGGLCRQPVQPHPGGTLGISELMLEGAHAVLLPVALHALLGTCSTGTPWSPLQLDGCERPGSPVCGFHGMLRSVETALVACVPLAATGGALQGYLRGGPSVCGQLWRGGGPGPACLHHEPAAKGLGAHAA